jgi:hypothetical protein
MASIEGADVSTPSGITAIAESVTYYLNLRLSAKEAHVNVAIPAAVEQIVELASGLPLPSTQNWASLAVGKMPKEAKSKAAKPEGEGGAARSRGKWSEANKEELVKMVEDASFRTEILGSDGTRNGFPNWSALARRYGFSGVAPIHRQYQAITNKDPPGIKAKPAKEGDEGGEPAAKRAKKETNGAGTSKGAAAADVAVDGWTKEACDILVKLVEDAAYRKAQTGKKKLKWSKIAENIGKHKKESKRKYTQITGKEAPESE